MPERSAEDALSRWLDGPGVALLDALAAEAPDIIGVMDRDLVIRYVNYAGPGMTRETAVGRNVLDLTAPDTREAARKAYHKVLETGDPARFESMYQDGDDVRMWEVRVGPIRFEGKIIGVIGLTTNVTEQRRADADRDRFFSLSLDMLVVASPKGQIKRANPAFGEALGYDATELSGTPIINLLHPEDRARTAEAFGNVLKGVPLSDLESRYLRKDGGHCTVSWRATVDPVTGDIYAVGRDVTEHRATENQLRHAQKLEAVGQLAGGIAHDFNNLMMAVLANAELALASTPPSSDLAELLREIQGAGRRAADLTKQLLAFSRHSPMHLAPVDLNELTRGIIRMLRRILPENVTVETIAGTNLAPLSADPTQLEQVLVNLCVNARDAMDRGGQLTIETGDVLLDDRYRESHPWARPGRYVLLKVTDTGSGMTAEVRERAFEPFFSTKGARGGTGLGLSTVYGIVRQHDGIIDVQSEPGAGTTIEVFLPAGGQATVGESRTAKSVPPGGLETILLAEDEPSVRRAVVQMLQLAGYRTITAANGVEAIRLLEEQSAPVHLAILDVVMPELGGPETWERLRGQHPDLRVLFTSGYADGRYVGRLPEKADLLEKPFQMEELLRRVRRKLDE